MMTQAPRPIHIFPDRVALEPLDLDPAAFQSPLPQQNYALIFEDEEIGLAVGIWDTTTMQEAFGPYPGDEYITVLDGSFAMVDAARTPIATAGRGDSVTFRNGAPSSWKQEGYLRKVYLTLQPPEGNAPDIASAKGAFRVLGAGQRPQGTPGPDGVTREVIFRNDAGTMTVSLCGFPALSLPAAPTPAHRLIRVLAGSVTLTLPGGTDETLGSGAHVFLPRGCVLGWSCTAGTLAVFVDVTA
jgi:uncharacterized cupin superfamily protein